MMAQRQASTANPMKSGGSFSKALSEKNRISFAVGPGTLILVLIIMRPMQPDR